MMVICILNSEKPGDEFAYFMRPFVARRCSGRLRTRSVPTAGGPRSSPSSTCRTAVSINSPATFPTRSEGRREPRFEHEP